MADKTLEERVSTLEAEVAELKQYLLPHPDPTVIGRTRPDLLKNFTGLSANSPLFDEVAAEIEAAREREREEARRLADEDEAALSR